MNLRMTIARLVMSFDIKFAPADAADNGMRFEKETWEHFTLVPANLGICFLKRG